MRQLNRLIIAQSKGQFIGVTFIKKNGSTRSLNGRLGVHIDNKHTGANRQPKYLNIYDVKAKGWRKVNLDAVLSIRMNKEVIELRRA